jgi:ribosomal protein L11 methyltransferase
LNSKSLWRIAVSVPFEAEEAVAELFARIFEHPASSYSDFETRLARITIYFKEKPHFPATRRAELAAGLKAIRDSGLKIGRPKVSLKLLPRQDWAESWKEHFHPIEIGSSLLIKPSWSKQQAKKGQATIILDPGLSFGTGQHPTTEYCLRELVRRRKRLRKNAAQPFQGCGTRGSDPQGSLARSATLGFEAESLRDSKSAFPGSAFLDIGTGSGILPIAAARLGYGPIDAFDFDPEAVRIASANARRNRVLEKIHFFKQDVTKLSRTGAKYSMICANLISNLLMDVRDRILGRLRNDGMIVLAGILRSEFEEVQRTYEKAGLKLVKCGVQKEWRSGTFAWRKG